MPGGIVVVALFQRPSPGGSRGVIVVAPARIGASSGRSARRYVEPIINRTGCIVVSKTTCNRSARRGAAVVETAVVLGTFLMVTMGIFEYGRLVMVRQLMSSAARAGARKAAVGTADSEVTTQSIRDSVIALVKPAKLDNLNVQVYGADPDTGLPLGAWEQVAYGRPIAVQVDGDYTPCLPTTLGIVPSRLHFTAISTALSESN
ncbi:TadE/TadG family type IV pilus assembly protein [Aquisphaera insulae]|uniref:TadE/TadG family type IV pilus assembly protein n=1 Tax=Aquisphaera insulae TaxID=2712864 RepID=UPI0021106A62|nr:TadE family protein [Aquisphaera insulae]